MRTTENTAMRLQSIVIYVTYSINRIDSQTMRLNSYRLSIIEAETVDTIV